MAFMLFVMLPFVMFALLALALVEVVLSQAAPTEATAARAKTAKVRRIEYPPVPLSLKSHLRVRYVGELGLRGLRLILKVSKVFAEKLFST